jgi:hypothetical protein
MSLQLIREHLENGFTYLIIPEQAMMLPIEMAKMQKEDEEGNSDGYYSLQELTQVLGKLLVPIKMLDDAHVAIRWSFDEDGDEKTQFIAYMEELGLINIRPVGAKVENMDFSVIPANGFMVCSLREMRYLPKFEVVEEL